MAWENHMSVRRSLIPLALALFAARCADGPHPTAVQQPPTPHFLRWSAPPQFTATGALSGVLSKGRTQSLLSRKIARIKSKCLAEAGDCFGLLLRLKIAARFGDFLLNVILPHQFSRCDSGDVGGIKG